MTTEPEVRALVEVNQRALVDKILARYPGEFTLFRELLQNSDDAGSSNVEIRFETASYQLPARDKDTPIEVVRWIFRNDGSKFDDDDWKRLPKIAEGNPKPEKIGAFGVGFYSIFSVTDNPRVSSGGYEMEFYWENNGNQLYTCRRPLPQQDDWTTFTMPLREPGPMLPVLDLMRFLASSITFMVNLTAVGVFLDDDHIGHIKRTLELSQIIVVPEEIKRSSPESIMRVKEVQSHSIAIDAEIKNAACAFSEAKDSSPMEISKSRVNLTIFTAEVDVMVDEKFSGELCRCIKKKPPPRLKYSLVYTGKGAHDRNSVEQQNHRPEVASIFRGLHADLESATHTRIFIGHATGQTTSIGGHMASRFIPTVERESIDFVDKYVSVWNKELLYIGGFLCRVIYEQELFDIQHLWEAAPAGTLDPEQLSKSLEDLHRRFLHVLKFFAFHDSTPSPKVSQILHESFYNCSASVPRLLSSVGVRAAPDIRMFDPQIAKFLNSIPMLSELVGLEAARHINGLPDPCKILPVAVKDVLHALNSHPLREEKLAFCLEWWLKLEQNDSSLQAAELLNVVSFDGASGVSHTLSQTECFINTHGLGAHILRDGPLPESLLPFNVSMHFTPADLMKLGWKELTVMDWFRHISQKDVMLKDPIHDFTKSSDWAKRVLTIVSLAWSSLSDEERRAVKTVFEDTTCIPTSDGLRRPVDSYLPAANDTLLHKFNLPVVSSVDFELDKEMGTMLSFVGVQTHIPLELLSDRMLDTGEWSTSDFISYLVRLPHPLTTQQISALKSSRRFPDDANEKSYYCAGELYPPVEIFRRLELPVIKWNKKWLDDSDEAELLYRLGLRAYPPLEKIIELSASPNISIRGTAFTYFCDNIRSKYSDYDPKNFHDAAFVPAENKEGACLKAPGDVFLDVRWKALGFSVVQDTYRKLIASELGIQQHPPPSMLLHLLETTPPSNEEAREWYECLFVCIQIFAQSELTRISELKIVPTPSPDSPKWLAPNQCYLGSSADEFHSKLFVFVNFGTKANHFLSACGSMDQPSVKDVAESLIHDPDRFYKLAGSHDGFLDKLRDLAKWRAYIPNDTLNKMSRQRTLLGQRREKVGDQDEWKPVYELCKPKEIVIVDDPRDYELFGDAIYTAPRDELLESFYSSIGCRRLSTVVHERYENSTATTDTKMCSEVRALILQRLDSFLKKCSHHQHDQMRDPRTKDFSVVLCERLLVHKTLNIGGENTPRKQDLWAVTKCNDDGSMELWLSRHARRDMYDLAASLCRLLFGRVKDTDAFLLAAMLSSDLELLKRAGYDVDQFSEQKSSQLVETPATSGVITTDGLHSSVNLVIDQGSVPQVMHGYVRHPIVDPPGYSSNTSYTVEGTLTTSPRTSTTSKYPNIRRQVIHQSYIRDIVNNAAKARSAGSNRLLDDKDDIAQFLRHYSCNDFAQTGNLRSLGNTPEGIEIHVAGGVPDICAFIAGKQELLARFIRVVTRAASAHKLPIEELHIFYDVGGGPIAFNSEGSIYLNLRYFEEWHDEDVKNNRLKRAQLSWFFVLAHEIAHNLVPSHDSAHEFWFSAICEAHISDLFATEVTDTRCIIG